MDDSYHDLMHVERMLFVVGDRNAGKSTELRSMFVDPRFGTKGKIPSVRRVKPVDLSRERGLYFRITSPHETNEDCDEFFEKIDDQRKSAAQTGFRRFNFAGALQPFAVNRMTLDLPDLNQKIIQRFRPERVRYIILNPRRDARPGPEFEFSAPSNAKFKYSPPSSPSISYEKLTTSTDTHVEVVWINAQHLKTEPKNGFMLADFFDFT